MAGRVREWFTQIKRWALPNLGYFKTAPRHVETPEEHLTKALGKYESYVFKIQSILKWDDPLISVLCILAANFIFWFVVNFECRFYGLIFSSILVCFVYDMWVDKIWPEISIPVPEKDKPEEWTPRRPSGVLSVPEISHYISQTNYVLKDCYIYMKTLRSEQPAVFCFEMCMTFALLAVVGRTVPGPVIGYLLLMAVLIGPGVCIHVLPRSSLDRLINVVSGFRPAPRGETDSDVDELLPDGSEANMALFQGALDGDASDREDTNEFCLETDSSCPTSSVMRDDASMDTLDDFDLSPQAANHSPTHSDSGDEAAGIHFRSSHFNGDSSDDDDMQLARGLAFPDAGSLNRPVTSGQTVASDGRTALLTGLAHNLTNYVGAMGASLVSTVVTRATAPATLSRKSSTDSNDEFEIINKDEVS